MSRRDEILEEMGLAPVWRLRESKEEAVPAAAFSEGKGGEEEKTQDWIRLKEAVPACTACALHKGRKQTVFGVGDENADWLLVGEAPAPRRTGWASLRRPGGTAARQHARRDRPQPRRQRHIANVLKCRPPGNRNPEPEEVAKCTPYLQRQIG